jgi:hypothetical protein
MRIRIARNQSEAAAAGGVGTGRSTASVNQTWVMDSLYTIEQFILAAREYPPLRSS